MRYNLFNRIHPLMAISRTGRWLPRHQTYVHPEETLNDVGCVVAPANVLGSMLTSNALENVLMSCCTEHFAG